MTTADPVERPGGKEPEESARVVASAAGIYGLIVTASVVAAVGSYLPTLPLAIAIFVTVLVYWLAEEYAAQIEHTSAGHLPSWAKTRAGLKKKWPLVSASFIPMVTLFLARLLGATPTTAAVIALVVITLMLTLYGWRAGRAAELHGLRLVVMTLLAGALGLLMIFLKVVLVNIH